MMIVAWYYAELFDGRELIPVSGQQLTVMDGDSFVLGNRKLRLDGIDAPEYKQKCNDASGIAWECGKTSRIALEQMLRQPNLNCTAEFHDQYARSIATCSNDRTPDIGAAQVTAGMAISDNFYGVRTYENEETEARRNQRGIWVGTFTTPSEWRKMPPHQKAL
jgi:endonuclease YncB( thermonuclease family)